MHGRKSGRPGGRRWILAITALLVAVLGVPLSDPRQGDQAQAQISTVGATAADRQGPGGVLAPNGRWTVTLLTGEVVDVQSDADGQVSATVREQMSPFRTVRYPNGDLHVIPLAVTPLLDHVLDPELFNVTGLIRQGYDDDSRAAIGLIVQRQPGIDVQATLSTVSPGEQPLPSIDAVAVEVPKANAAATGELIDQLTLGAGAGGDVQAESLGGITHMWLDRQVTAESTGTPTQEAPQTAESPDVADVDAAAPAPETPEVAEVPGLDATARTTQLDGNLTQIGADDAWSAGWTGDGVRVAVLDTGIDAQHPDLAGQIVAEQNFSESEDTVDRFGHGTHVAALVAGTGAAADGARQGVAPGADLVVGKVLNDFGFGWESDIIAGMEWAAPQADVVNMSLGALFPSPDDPLSAAVDTLTEQYGTLFVTAAGNDGPVSQTVGSPGLADRALTVGAVASDDTLADFSSRGPVAGSYELKPEVVAPGVDIVAARAAGTAMGDVVDDSYTTASGTSMATPHVAGAAALLAQQHPDWTADELKNMLVGSADPIDGDGYDVGAGRVDIGDGVAASLRADRDVIEASLPHPRTEPHAEPLTWTNTGSEPLTLTLDAELEDRDGTPIDEVTVEPGSLTIDPGATASATVTIDGPDIDPALYSGVITAVEPDGDDTRTPVAVHAAAEHVDLTITATNLPGTAPGSAPNVFVAVVNLDDFALFNYVAGFEGDSLTVPVPVGRYAVIGDVSSVGFFGGDHDSEAVAQVGDPDVTVTGDTTVTFDGAGAVPFHPTVEGVETAPPMYSSTAMAVTPRLGTGGFGLWTVVYTWHPMPPVFVAPIEADPDVFTASQIFRLQAQHLTARAGDEAIEVTTAHNWPGPAAGEHTLAAVDAGDGSDLSGATGRLAVVQLPADLVERAAVTQRALDAGVGLLAFVDEQRSFLTLEPYIPERWADVPVIAVADSSATTLLAAARAGADVTTNVVASPYVYDIVTPETNAVDPNLVIDQAEQAELARLDERFHRDPDGTGSVSDRRYPVSVDLMNLDSEGPLPERRTAYVTPDITWESMAIGLVVDWIGSYSAAVSQDAGASYAAGSDGTLTWLRRPMWPGPVGGPSGASACQPLPVTRSIDTLRVWLAPFQDRLDGYGCGDPIAATLTLARDGVVLGSAPVQYAELPIPPERGSYTLTYEQEGQAPYVHRSSTTWTFGSSAPTGDEETPIPLLVVGYELPLDTLNHPIGDTATLTVRRVTGANPRRVTHVKAWTSVDGGVTWQPAVVNRSGDGRYELTLPDVEPGTAVSLRVDARDSGGSRINQTLFDAYTG